MKVDPRGMQKTLALALAMACTGAVALSLSPGIAAAFAVPGVATLTGGAPVTLAPGATAQSLNSFVLSIAHNSSTSVWSNGDQLTFELWDSTAGSELSNPAANTLDSAAFEPAVTVDSTNPSSAATLALASGPTSSAAAVRDEFVLTFGADAPKDALTSVFTISNLRLDLGANVPAGHHVQIKAISSNGTPFNGGVGTAFIDVGAIRGTTVSAAPVVAGQASSTVILGTIRLSDFAGGSIHSGDTLLLTLSNGKWGTAPARSGSPTISGVTGLGTAVLSLTASSTSAPNDVLTLSGGSITLPASVGPVVLTITDGGVPLGSATIASTLQQARIGGSDRYATAGQLFDSQFTTTPNVVLTSGTNFPDALSATYLAKQFSTGVLTTDPSSLSPTTQAELGAHGVTTVYIVGGVAAVSAAVASQVAALHVSNNLSLPLITVVRVSGADRYATNAAVDAYRGATSATAIVASGANFADALSVGPAVYKTGYPLVLTAAASLSPSAKTALQSLGVQHVVILGGTAAVSSAVESSITALGITVDYRIAGADRTLTAAQIASWETGGLPATGGYGALPTLGFGGSSRVDIARGDNFADALAAGAVAGAGQSPLLLTATPTTVGAGIPSYLVGRSGTVAIVQAIGLQSAVSDAVLAAVGAYIT